MSEILTPDELTEITGAVQSAAQRRVLDEAGIFYSGSRWLLTMLDLNDFKLEIYVRSLEPTTPMDTGP